MPITKKKLSAITATLLMGLLAWGGAHAGIKCWTNAEGVKECGNTVPPEFIQGGHSEVNAQGITTTTVGRAKTAEELALEKQALQEQDELKKLAKEQANRDRVLLHTFTTENDLILARDEKLAAIDARIKHTRLAAEGLHEQLDRLEEDAASQEIVRGSADEELLNAIGSVQSQLEENALFIAEREREKDSLRAKYDADLTRYRTLKALSSVPFD